MMARRVEAQLRWDWDFLLAVWSLHFVTKVNLGVSMSIRKILQKCASEKGNAAFIGRALEIIYKLLWSGEYRGPTGQRLKINCAVSKLPQAIGLTTAEQALFQNYNFMSSRIAGTRQLRRCINHVIFSSRNFYGLPVFLIFTPSERHSGLVVRFSRYRAGDPGIVEAAPEFTPWIGYDSPLLQVNCDADCSVDLPDYALARLMSARDPLACVYAFQVMIRVVAPGLFGLRMCPDCQNCATSEQPCMDVFGSNWTPMGGSNGRADAMVGAVEAQKAEGVLHLHFFLYCQQAHQFQNSSEIAEGLRKRWLSVTAIKQYHNHVRCSKYPDLDGFNEARKNIEQSGPAFASDYALNRAPSYAWESLRRDVAQILKPGVDLSDWQKEGSRRLTEHDQRLQFVMARMSHHIHPLVDGGSGERRPLSSCFSKGNNKDCKSGFSLHNQMTDEALLICPCIAQERDLPMKGPRGCIGSIMQVRNEPNLNACRPAWTAFSGDNGDIKLPLRLPMLPETHEAHLYDVRRCCSDANMMELAFQVQTGQTAVAGYFGGYSANMQDIGAKELRAMEQSISRKNTTLNNLAQAKAFHEYSRRLVRDLEGKGIIRTSVETFNLAFSAEHLDVLDAECIRTFPTAHFPALQVLKREEFETLKIAGVSVIACMHRAGSVSKRLYIDAPFDLVYGFRGLDHNVDVLSPYEMLLHWTFTEAKPPTIRNLMSTWTDAGIAYREECKLAQHRATYIAGAHYVAIQTPNRILLLDCPTLGTLRHRWVWEKRDRLHLPVWSDARIPKSNLSPEENARLLSVYMRPWTLHPDDANPSNPLLSELGFQNCVSEKECLSPSKRMRGKQSVPPPPSQPRRSYAAAWREYIDGHIVSESGRKYIMNMLSATSARVVNSDDESDGDSAENDMEQFEKHRSSLGIVKKTLAGIASNDGDDGACGLGRHASIISLGSRLWTTPDLTAEQSEQVYGFFF